MEEGWMIEQRRHDFPHSEETTRLSKSEIYMETDSLRGLGAKSSQRLLLLQYQNILFDAWCRDCRAVSAPFADHNVADVEKCHKALEK